MTPVLTVGQCFGILPVLGIRKPDASHLKYVTFSQEIFTSFEKSFSPIFYPFFRFVWLSWVMAYALLNIVCAGFVCLMCLMRMIFDGVDLFKTGKPRVFHTNRFDWVIISVNFSVSFVFYSSTMLVLVLFIRLAKRWPALISSIARQERPRRLTGRPLHSRFSWCCLAVLLPALGKYIVSN